MLIFHRINSSPSAITPCHVLISKNLRACVLIKELQTVAERKKKKKTKPKFQLGRFLWKARVTRDFYVLLNRKIHTVRQTGPMNWNNITRLDENAWKKIFTSLKSICKETKLKEFQFKLIHRIAVTKKELHRYGIKADDKCLYCGKKDSIDHTFLKCRFVEIFVNNVIDWFNAANNSKFAPTIEEKLFGIISGPYEKEILRNFNYTILFMKYYIHTSKMHSQGIYLSIFVNKVLFKYRIESFSL